MLDCGFNPLMSSLSDKQETRGCVVATRDKTTVLVPAGARIVYFTQSSFNIVVCCFEFTLLVGFATEYQRDVLDRYLKVDDSSQMQMDFGILTLAYCPLLLI